MVKWEKPPTVVYMPTATVGDWNLYVRKVFRSPQTFWVSWSLRFSNGDAIERKFGAENIEEAKVKAVEIFRTWLLATVAELDSSQNADSDAKNV